MKSRSARLITRATVWTVALVTPSCVCADVTLPSLLDEMTDYAAVARWPQPEFTCKQAGSYDRGTVAPDKPGWFANSDSVGIEFGAPDAAARRLVLCATQASDYAVLCFGVSAQFVAATFDGYAGSVRPAPAFPLGVFAPRDRKFVLRVEIEGAKPAAKGAK